MSGFAVKVDLSGLQKRLGAVVDASDAAVRPAAQAGAQVFYDRARQLVPVGKKGHYFHGTSFKVNGTKYYFNAGSLKAAIYQVYSEDNSGQSRATYHVAWNHRKVPYGFMVEFGTSKAQAHSFIRASRPYAKKVRDAMQSRYIEELKASGVLR